MTLKLSLTSISLALLITAPGGPATAQTTPAATERNAVTRADQLPRRNYTLAKLPSEYISAPLSELRELGARFEADLRADLMAYDIQDATTLRGMYTRLATLAQLRRDWTGSIEWSTKARALQDKPGLRAVTGLLTDLLSQQQAEQRDGQWLTDEVRRRYGALNWAETAELIKSSKSQLETFNPELQLGTIRSQLDPLARNADMSVPASVLGTLITARVQVEYIGPQVQALIAGLQAVVDANSSSVAKPDIWSARTFALAANAPAKRVVVGIWDSGVDLSLFKPAPARGVAFDAQSKPAESLLRPLGDTLGRWPQWRTLLQGSLDQNAQVDSPAARQYRSVLANVKADQAKTYGEDLLNIRLHTHGTHVAGIAVEGNPFAEVFATSMLWSASTEPDLPTEALSQATAASYRASIEAMKRAGVRVVNMSWRETPRNKDLALAFHNQGGTAEQRKALAQRLFKIERDALQGAMAAAPEILFVAASGNEDNSADFEDYIPAGLTLPNLITVGAADKSGSETSFSSFGRTVAVYANGFEVESFLPGGERIRFSGTSMASPQVANLAAKLIALKPDLTPVQVKDLILRGAERLPGPDGKPGRVNLIDPRKTAALAGLAI